jgi:Leucine-rich repeat (LRR) protein
MSYTFLELPEALNMPLQVKALHLPSSQDFSQLVHFPALEALQCTTKASFSDAQWAMLAQLPHLQTLHIDFVNTTVPEAFFACKGLKELHITIKGTFAISQDRFAELQVLEHFTLTERYDAAPDTILLLPSVFQIKSLRSLVFSATRLKDLPQDAFTQLKNLESLELTYTKADEARLTSIFSCSKLQKLALHLQKYAKGAVPFEMLPSSIGTLTHLTELAVTGHKFKALPDSLNQLTHLESLNLYGNHFTDLPFRPASFQRLHSLSLIQNKI